MPLSLADSMDAPARSTPSPVPVSQRERFDSIRRASIDLAAPLEIEDWGVQSMPDASPTKWHLAHTTWFFETFVLRPFVPDYRVYHERFGFLFNSYYQTVGRFHARPSRGLLSRPTAREVVEYRTFVEEAMHRLFDGGLDEEQASVVEVGLHHEQQHAELLLTDIKHAFFTNPMHPAYRREAPARPDPAGNEHELRYHPQDGGVQCLGSRDQDAFFYDNEQPRHRIFVNRFALASRMVTNREFLEFIADGGYQRPDLWLSEGWSTVQRGGWLHPLYWERRDNTWWEFTLDGWKELDLDAAAVHISYFEADAFARWEGSRLPTEGEMELFARLVEDQEGLTGNFVETKTLRTTVAPRNAALPRQVFGDAWEWTKTPYSSYPGYRTPKGAIGEYNGKFMCNQMVLRGGSFATPQSHMRASYRNFFPPHARWQFSGLRLARDE